MIDKEKTIEGLECLLKYYGNENDSSKCPYRDDVPNGMYCADCIEQIARDALALLKQQGSESMERRKYYVYGLLSISVVWLNDDEYLKFISKHWDKTVVLAK